MGKLKALDLYCGGGGACLGLLYAGFDTVVGIDISTHKHYPGDFIQSDVFSLPVDISDFHFVWASPPCQRYSVGTNTAHHKRLIYPDLLPVTRQLIATHPFTCIENVPGAPMRKDVILTGPSMGLPRIQRNRYFENSFFMLYPKPLRVPREMWNTGQAVTITKSLASKSHFYPRKAHGLPGKVPVWEAKQVMGIPQSHRMTANEIGEAVPPPYAEFVGREALKQIKGGYYG